MQLGYIYNILPNTLRLQTYQELQGTSNSADRLIGSMTQGYLGRSSQNLGYAHSSTQNMSQPGFQSHHMPQQNLTNRAQTYHQGGPYPPAEGTQYAGRKTDRRTPPRRLGENMRQQYVQSQAHNPPTQNNAQVNFVQLSQNQPHQYDQENYPPNMVKKKIKKKPKGNPR